MTFSPQPNRIAARSRAGRSIVISSILLAACGSTAEDVGVLSARLQVSDLRHDVTAVRYAVVNGAEACSGTPIGTATVPLETEALPVAQAPEGAGALHPFADAFFTLAPGQYRVCVTPLAGQAPSKACASGEALASVTAETTSEIVVVSQCVGAGRGGLDVITALNDPPVLDDLTIAPSKFITTCETATLTATASDPNGDAVSISWAVLSGPTGGSIGASSNPTTFTPGGPGDYTLEVKATDALGGVGRLTFPIHVSAADCGPRERVLIIHGNGPRDIEMALEGLNAFADVDAIDAGNENPVPTLVQLSAYQAVLFTWNTAMSPEKANALGDVLADYVDAGGRVVTALFGNSAAIGLQGRFVSDGYLLYRAFGLNQLPAMLGVVLEPGSPLLNGVNTITAREHGNTLTPLPGGIVVARWSTSAPMVIRGAKNGRPRVDLNLYPGAGITSGDVARLVANALLFQ